MYDVCTVMLQQNYALEQISPELSACFRAVGLTLIPLIRAVVRKVVFVQMVSASSLQDR